MQSAVLEMGRGAAEGGTLVQGPELDHVADVRRRAQAAMRELLADLRLLGFADHQLRGQPVEVLVQMRDDGFANLQCAPPPSDRAA